MHRIHEKIGRRIQLQQNHLLFEDLSDLSKGRTKKPRLTGITMVMDKGLGSKDFCDLLETASEFIDFIKLGFGTLVITPESLLKQKIEWAEKQNIHLYPGGTLFEIAYLHGKTEAYFHHLKELGIKWVEISEGTIDLPTNERQKIIRLARDLGLSVITEIGKKTSGYFFEPENWLVQYQQDIESGASYVIMEGRETGNIQLNWIEALHEKMDLGLVIFEAPTKELQTPIIQRLGCHANFGNIPPKEVISLECLRRGLRSETFSIFCL